MSPKLHYTVIITNIFTNETTTYEITGTIHQVTRQINEHYGCAFTSHAGVCNIITRPRVVSQRHACIRIKRYQTATKTYMDGEGGSHYPLVTSA